MNLFALRRLNVRETEGRFGSSSQNLDDLIIEHLDLVRLLRRFTAREEAVARLAVEGYSQPEMAEALGCLVRTVYRTFREIYYTIYGFPKE